jgi:ribonucleotide monophosphatase NagD (HAD superfamily)
MDARLEEIDAIFLDLDGTIYLGSDLIEGALEFLQRCEDRGVRRFFL